MPHWANFSQLNIIGRGVLSSFLWTFLFTNLSILSTQFCRWMCIRILLVGNATGQVVWNAIRVLDVMLLLASRQSELHWGLVVALDCFQEQLRAPPIDSAAANLSKRRSMYCSGSLNLAVADATARWKWIGPSPPAKIVRTMATHLSVNCRYVARVGGFATRALMISTQLGLATQVETEKMVETDASFHRLIQESGAKINQRSFKVGKLDLLCPTPGHVFNTTTNKCSKLIKVIKQIYAPPVDVYSLLSISYCSDAVIHSSYQSLHEFPTNIHNCWGGCQGIWVRDQFAVLNFISPTPREFPRKSPKNLRRMRHKKSANPQNNSGEIKYYCWASFKNH